MTDEEKSIVVEMKKAGLGARRIAHFLGLSVNTVKSYLRNHPEALFPGEPCDDFCHFCGKPIIYTPKAKKRKFCSDQCRLAWWKAHPDKLNRKAFYPKICPSCGQSYMAYGRPNQKYCSRKCFANARRKNPTMKEQPSLKTPEWDSLSYEEKNHQLYLSQKALLGMFLEHGAISQAQHDKSLHDLREKMGESE